VVTIASTAVSSTVVNVGIGLVAPAQAAHTAAPPNEEPTDGGRSPVEKSAPVAIARPRCLLLDLDVNAMSQV